MTVSTPEVHESPACDQPANRREAIYRFGQFRLTTIPLALTCDGRPVEIQPQPARALEILLSRPGELVSREELRERLWGLDTHVAFDQGINFTIRKLRSTLGDSAESPRFIETLPRQGYRFIAPVERMVPVEAPPGGALPPVRRSRLRRWAALGGLLVIVIGLAVAALLQRRARSEPRGPHQAPQPAIRLAVLPFASAGTGSPEASLREVLTEELITHLASRFGDRVGVISLGSARAVSSPSVSLEEAAQALSADYLLRGTVRGGGEDLQLRFRLWRADDRLQVWARVVEQSYRRLPELYDEVALEIGTALGTTVLLVPATRAESVSPEIWELYVRGRYLASRSDEPSLVAAAESLEEAASAAPGFAPVQVALGRAYLGLAAHRPFAEVMPRAESAAQRALEIDAALPEAHYVRAAVSFYYHLDWRGAESALAEALRLSPKMAQALQGYGLLLSARGRHREALSTIRQAVELDPATIYVTSDLAQVLFRARRWADAADQARSNLEVTPDDVSSLLLLERALRSLGDDRGALEQWNVMAKLYGGPPADSLEEATARSARWNSSELAAGRPVVLTELAARQVELGDLDAALASLGRACSGREDWELPFVAVDPRFDPLREMPGYTALGDCLIPLSEVESNGPSGPDPDSR